MQRQIAFILMLYITIGCVSCHSKSGQHAKNPAGEGYIKGKVIHIVDGDTYDLLVQDSLKIRVRIEGIDAPEKGMPFYSKSKDYLKGLCINKYVKLKKTGYDSNNRVLGFTYLDDGKELAHEMIKAGFAWHHKKYNTDKDLSDLEIEARNAKRGLWADSTSVAPWEIKTLRSKGISTKDTSDNKHIEVK
jgi:endonuclease YncB( thermonuclease family)